MNTCEICGERFEPDRYHQKAATCGSRCSDKRMDRVRRERTAAKRAAEGRMCAWCGHPFVAKAHAGKQLFCGKKCADREMGRRYRGRYPGKDKLRQRHARWDGSWMRAMLRDDRKCVTCGSQDYLHVHHKDNSGSDEHPNHSLENLETLCAMCHKQLHQLNWRVVDGRFLVSGPVFERMGITEVTVEKIDGE